MEVAAEIAEDIGSLIAALERMGLKVEDSQYDAQSFGNFHVDVSGRRGRFRIVRDRSQYMLYAKSLAQIKLSGMFRAFDSRDEFEAALLKYARTVV